MAKTSGGSHMTVHVSADAKEKIKAALKTGLRQVGMQAESNAKALCPFDTGLLRNSITFAIGGETAHISSYAADNGDGSGSYEGSAPADADGTMTLYLGSNVQYAPYVELGHHQQPGRYVPAIGKRLVNEYVAAKPFLRPAIENYAEQYNQILISALNAIK